MDDAGVPQSRRIFRPQFEAPPHELPVVLATPELVWRGEGVAIAIPSLYVYSAGAEMLTLCRTEHRQPRGKIEHAKAVMAALDGLTVNALPLHPQSGQHSDYGFTYRHWIVLEPAGLNGDLTFALAWPGVQSAERHIPAARINAAMRDVVILWSLPGEVD